MKHIFLIYAFISLIILAVLSVLSYTAGSGYVYVLWHNIQVQTNLWFLTFAGVGISFLMHVAWYFSPSEATIISNLLGSTLGLDGLYHISN